MDRPKALGSRAPERLSRARSSSDDVLALVQEACAAEGHVLEVGDFDYRCARQRRAGPSG